MNQFAPWTPEEDKTLWENAHLPRKELMELLPGRSLSAILSRAQKKGWPMGNNAGRGKWTEEELEIVVHNAHLPSEEIQKLLPGRTIHAINIKRSLIGALRGYAHPDMVERGRRPLTDETAYQCRIEYEQKREYGYTHDEAVLWVAEANERDVDIVRDILTNPKYDAEVEECRKKIARMVSTELPDMDEASDMLRRLVEAGPEQSGYTGEAIVGTNIKTGEKVYFPSQRAAGLAGFSPNCISHCLGKRQKSHKGYIWERLKDYEC